MKCLQLVKRRRVVLLAATVAGLGLGLGLGPLQLAHADGYPAKPVQLVVPFPPGGAVDIVGRTISKKLGDRLGQPIVVRTRRAQVRWWVQPMRPMHLPMATRC